MPILSPSSATSRLFVPAFDYLGIAFEREERENQRISFSVSTVAFHERGSNRMHDQPLPSAAQLKS